MGLNQPLIVRNEHMLANVQTSSRAGTYVRHPEGLRAFSPKALPPDPPLSMDDELQALLSQADCRFAKRASSISRRLELPLYLAIDNDLRSSGL